MRYTRIRRAGWAGLSGRYAMALLFVAIALMVSWNAPHIFRTRPFLAFYPAVVAAAALCGMGPGIVCAVVAAVCVDLFITPPFGKLSFSDLNELASLVIFALSGIAISLMAGAKQRERAACERRAAEAAAMAEQLQSRVTAIEATADMVVITDPAGVIQYVNPAFTDVTGYSLEEALGKNPKLLKSGVHSEAFYRELWMTILSGKVWRGEMTNRRKNGALYSEEISITPVNDEGGKVIHFVAIKREVTHRKAAEKDVQENRQRLAAIVDSAMDAIITVNEQQQIVLFNPAAEQMFRCSAAEVMGGPLDRLIPQRHREAHHGHIHKFGETGQTPRTMGYLKPLAALRCDGQEFPIEASISRVTVGEHQLFTVIIRDITERRRVEAELKAARMSAERAKAVAEDANSAKDRFLAVLSHELRTPLTAVIPSLEALEGMVPGEARAFLTVARRNAELEARLIDDLLDVTRIARGKIELNLKLVDLTPIVRHASEVCIADMEARRLHFEIRNAGGPFFVKADAGRLQQVFWNLLKNAVKFTPEGGYVHVDIGRAGDAVAVEVSDSGQGIEPSALHRIFNAFEQEARATTRQFGGLGLGLAITKSLVELHGGTISAHSEGKGKGARFRVEMPVIDAGTAGEKVTILRQSVATQTRPLRILLVEDHGDTAHILTALLRLAGHDVKHAWDVATALKVADNQYFDVLLSDLGLPDGTGHDLMRTLRDRGKTMPGIALSGYGMAADVEQSRIAGFSEHITKPANFELLKAALQRVMV